MDNAVIHKGWDWKSITNEAWENVSAEFLPISLDWGSRFNSMIDIGAGKGRHSFHMDSLGLNVCAVDLSQSSIDIINERCKKENRHIEAKVSDMTSLPYENETFDCAICFHTIYHTDYQGLIKSINEIKRVLKVNGEAFITFNSKDNPSFKKGVAVDKFTIYKTSGIEANIPHTYVDMDDIKDLMDGFKLLKVQKIENFYYKGEPTGGNHYYVLAKKYE